MGDRLGTQGAVGIFAFFTCILTAPILVTDFSNFGTLAHLIAIFSLCSLFQSIIWVPNKAPYYDS